MTKTSRQDQFKIGKIGKKPQKHDDFNREQRDLPETPLSQRARRNNKLDPVVEAQQKWLSENWRTYFAAVAVDAGASLGLQGGSGSPTGSVARRSATLAVLL